MKLRKILFLVGLFGTIIASFVGSVFVAYEFGLRNTEPTAFAEVVFDKLFGIFDLESPVALDRVTRQYGSTFVQLEGRSVNVPADRAGFGGGLTTFGDDVLLLTHEGRILVVRSPDEVFETSIEAPPNGFSAYQRAAKSDRFKNLRHIFDSFRYNDILHFNADWGRGLALSYTEYNESEACYTNTIAILSIDPNIQSVENITAGEEDWNVVYRSRPCLPLKETLFALEGAHAGGRMVFRAPSTIYLANGDYHWDGLNSPEILPQRLDNDYGKVVEIDLASRQAKIVSMGHRNIQGIAFDRSGQLWTVEHGMRGGDELNLVEQGKNYGWPLESFGTLYSWLPIPVAQSYGRHENFTPPVYAWVPSVAISSLHRIEGFHESWDGDLLMASLHSRSLFRIRIKDNRVIFNEQIRIGARVRYALPLRDGRIVLWTDLNSLIFLTISDRNFAVKFIQEQISQSNFTSDQQANVEAAINECMVCHGFEPQIDNRAPVLTAVFEAPIASTGFDGYSSSLKAREGRWTREALQAFLQDPEKFAPGTAMPKPSYNDPVVLDALIDLLEALKIQAEKPQP